MRFTSIKLMTIHHSMACLGLLLVCLSSCTQPPPPKVQWSVWRNFYGVKSFTHSKEKVGDVGYCSKLVVVLGAGMIGYDSFIIDDANNVEIHLRHDSNMRQNNYSHPAYVYATKIPGDKPFIKSLLKSLSLGDLWSQYQTDMADGTDAGFAMVGKDGEARRGNMNNYYPPEFHQLCHRIKRLVEAVPEDQWQHKGRADRLKVYDTYMRENHDRR